jgi:hypothetical protein
MEQIKIADGALAKVDGKSYQYSADKGKWFPYDPVNERRLPGVARTDLSGEASGPEKRKTYEKVRKRKERKHKKIEAAIQGAKKHLAEVGKEISRTRELQEMIARAPSVRDQRKAILALFMEKGFSPIAELIDYLQDPGKASTLPIRDKIQILKILSEFEAPKPKTVDIEGEIKSAVTIQVIDYSQMSQRAMKEESIVERDTAGDVMDLTDADYEEFETEVT